MPAQEERLTALEIDLKHFKSETVKSYQDAVVDMLMVKGLAMTSVERLAAIRGQVEDFKQDVLGRFERQDRRVNAQNAHLDMHDKRFDALDQHLAVLEQSVNGRFDRSKRHWSTKH